MDPIEYYTLETLADLVQDLGQPRFRSTQLFEWLYGKGAQSYDDMTNLPKTLRTELAHAAPFSPPVIVDKRVSADGTRKYVLSLHDGCLVETVGIPSHDSAPDGNPKRLTVCFSTQVGCPMQCSFCATGQEGLTRNVLPGEMVRQLIVVAEDFGCRVSNAVAMGQGEPFLNFNAVVAALRMMNHPKGLALGARHITVSTCGIPEGIYEFSQVKEQFTLALSLHSAVQTTRNRIMPGCAAVPLEKLKEALLHYQSGSGRRITIEYLLIEGVNNSQDEFDALVSFCSGLSAHVNLLPLNKVEGSSLDPCPREEMRTWVSKLGEKGIEASVRDSRGDDICGACGQLKNAR